MRHQRIARLATQSGAFPVFEAEFGEVVASSPIRRQVPVEDYLKPQKRFAHLFSPTRRDDVIDRLQAQTVRNIRRYNLLPTAGQPPPLRCRGGTRVKQKPFAITLDVGSSLANETGSWRSEKPLYVDLLPPCSQACPAGENIQQWLLRGGELRGSLAPDRQGQPVPRDHGPSLLPPVPSSCNRAEIDEAVGINAVERFLGDEAIRKGWAFDPVENLSGKRVLVIGAGPSGLSAAYHLRRLGHEVHIREAGPMAGGMMRFGIPRSITACHAKSSTPRSSASPTSG